MFRINTNTLAMGALRNLNRTSMEAGSVMTRLSSGLRINSAADDPAGLQISEGFKSQIASINQAVQNNQAASNFAKTAEGALGEVAGLLKDARSLALANSNDATLSADQKQANQNQLNSIMASIDRISTNTQYGSKKLLDGSAGVGATVVKSATVASALIGPRFGTSSSYVDISTNGNFDVTVSTAAVKATVTGAALTATTAVGAAGNLTINGVGFAVSANMTNQQVLDAVNARSDDTGVRAAITGGNMVFTAVNEGTGSNNIQITNDVAGLGFAAVGTRTLGSGTAGVNAVADFTFAGGTAITLTAQATDGRSFKDSYGNLIKLTSAGAGTAATTTGIIAMTTGSAQFQIGANAGQTTSLSLGSSSASSLGLSSLDITTTSGVNTALTSIDSAISNVSVQRGSIGNFLKNVIESNVRSLGVAKENLSAANSAIEDADVAEEMTRFTQLQILQQSGMSMLAQANSSSQSILSLLRG